MLGTHQGYPCSSPCSQARASFAQTTQSRSRVCGFFSTNAGIQMSSLSLQSGIHSLLQFFQVSQPSFRTLSISSASINSFRPAFRFLSHSCTKNVLLLVTFVLDRILSLRSMKLGEPVSAVAAVVWRRLAVAVAKGVAQCLLRAYPGF